MEDKVYIAIDLKSFYASVECMERGLDPLTTCLVVADDSRTEKTICLAVSPALKSFGVPGRPRLFEVVQKVKEANARRRQYAPGHRLTGSTYLQQELQTHPEWAVDYIVAPPRMARYIDYSSRIYQIYLRHVAHEDIHVYSIDEVFIDATAYLHGRTPKAFAAEILRDVLQETGITATAGIGTNLYLAKIAMDIVAKKMPADKHGARIAQLNEQRYRETLWEHRPLTDFWRVGRGYAKKLEANGLYTMGDIARCSIGEDTDFYNERLLYKLFGINAELLIDHAWGWEPATIADIKSYRPTTNSICSGQVLHCAYTAKKARLVVREMADLLVYDLVEKGLVTDQIVLTIGYDIKNLSDPERSKQYHGEVTVDPYGRRVPKHAHGTLTLEHHTSSTAELIQAVTELYDRIIDPTLLVRRLNITANRILQEDSLPPESPFCQMDLFTDYEALAKQKEQEEQARKREKSMQHTLLHLKKKYGKNAVFKGMNLLEGATALERNRQIGGHKA